MNESDRHCDQHDSPAEQPLAVAEVASSRSRNWSWLLPAGVLLFMTILAWRHWHSAGHPVSVRFQHGHGIKPGDAVRYRGITIGEVKNVELDGKSRAVAVRIRLEQTAGDVARQGALFWIVRPSLNLHGAAGLETMIGARYLGVLPGEGPRQSSFQGLEAIPAVTELQSDGLELLLSGPSSGGVQPGAGVSYRRFSIGQVISVGLASDARTTDVRIYIEPPYVGLVRDNSRFWTVPAFQIHADLRTGVDLEVESLATLLAGGINLATPDQAGKSVTTGHRFELFDKPKSGWLEWQPALPVGASMLPPGKVPPRPLRTQVQWQKATFWSRTHERQGWLLAYENGVLGPASLLDPGEADAKHPLLLAVEGKDYSLDKEPLWRHGDLVLLELEIESEPWPKTQVRRPSQPEDCLLITDPAQPPVPLSAERLSPRDEGWRIDPTMPLTPDQQGACVVAQADGAVVGILIVEKQQGRIQFLP